MPLSPPFALHAWQVGLAVLYLILIANVVMIILNWRNWWLSRKLRSPFLLRLLIRDHGPKFSVELEVTAMSWPQADAVISGARSAIDQAAAEHESARNEQAVKRARHVP